MALSFTIDQLTQLVARALEAAPYQGQASGRVRDLPDKRTIRYYTTIGLLDRPSEMRGRTAYYGRRHVLQLVAIKRLQSSGMSLVEIQRSLAGADNRSLARWADLPADFWESVAELAEAASALPSPDEVLRQAPDRESFWAALPEAACAAAPPASPPPLAIRAAAVISLGPGVSLMLDDVEIGHLDEDWLAKLRQATAPLAQTIAELQARRDRE